MHDLALITGSERRLGCPPNRCFAAAMDIHRKALGESHPLVAVTLNNLSRVLR